MQENNGDEALIALTNRLSESCAGENVADVIGASLSLCYSAAKQIDEESVPKVATALRHIVMMIEPPPSKAIN